MIQQQGLHHAQRGSASLHSCGCIIQIERLHHGPPFLESFNPPIRTIAPGYLNLAPPLSPCGRHPLQCAKHPLRIAQEGGLNEAEGLLMEQNPGARMFRAPCSMRSGPISGYRANRAPRTRAPYLYVPGKACPWCSHPAAMAQAGVANGARRLVETGDAAVLCGRDGVVETEDQGAAVPVRADGGHQRSSDRDAAGLGGGARQREALLHSLQPADAGHHAVP